MTKKTKGRAKQTPMRRDREKNHPPRVQTLTGAINLTSNLLSPPYSIITDEINPQFTNSGRACTVGIG